jgi:hypothetical protein
LLAVVKIKEKVEVAPAGFLELEASVFLLVAHHLQQWAALQRAAGLEELPQGLPHPVHASINSGHIPAGCSKRVDRSVQGFRVLPRH